MVINGNNKHNQRLIIENNLGDYEKIYETEKEVEEQEWHVIYKKC